MDIKQKWRMTLQRSKVQIETEKGKAKMDLTNYW